MRINVIAFRGLSYEEYKERAEDVDQDAKERKVDHYAFKQLFEKSKSNSKSSGKPSSSEKDDSEKSSEKNDSEK